MGLLDKILLLFGVFVCIFAEDVWHDVKNPCAQDPHKIYYPHSSDQTKFIQCDLLGKMYIVQCPQGEVYDSKAKTCTQGQFTILITPPPTATVPDTTSQSTTTSTSSNILNPCTPENLAKNLTYFPHPLDHKKFIQCDLTGQMLIYECKPGLIWDAKRLSCVYNIYIGVIHTTTVLTPVSTTVGTTKMANPCKPYATKIIELFYPHTDPHKFLQCDMWGDVSEMDCPPSLVWNDKDKTCSSPYLFG